MTKLRTLLLKCLMVGIQNHIKKTKIYNLLLEHGCGKCQEDWVARQKKKGFIFSVIFLWT